MFAVPSALTAWRPPNPPPTTTQRPPSATAMPQSRTVGPAGQMLSDRTNHGNRRVCVISAGWLRGPVAAVAERRWLAGGHDRRDLVREGDGNESALTRDRLARRGDENVAAEDEVSPLNGEHDLLAREAHVLDGPVHVVQHDLAVAL